jgi:hypothetical protein
MIFAPDSFGASPRTPRNRGPNGTESRDTKNAYAAVGRGPDKKPKIRNRFATFLFSFFGPLLNPDNPQAVYDVFSRLSFPPERNDLHVASPFRVRLGISSHAGVGLIKGIGEHACVHFSCRNIGIIKRTFFGGMITPTLVALL